MIIDQTQSLFEDIVKTVREPLLVLDSDLKVLIANQCFINSFKVTEEETLGAFIYDLGNRQWDIPKLRELLENILPQKTSFDNYEVEHDFATIGKRIMLLNARQIQRALGKDRIILLAIEDITERKQLEELLIDSEERYRRLFETADDGILLLEKHELKIRHANPAIASMLGYSNAEYIGKDLKAVGFPDDMGSFNEILQTLNENGIMNFKNVLLHKKDEQVVDADIYMVDRASLVQCNVRDITKRKLSEEALRESQEKFQSIVDNIGIGVALISPTMEILELNSQMRVWFPDIDPSMRSICYRAFNNPPRDEICDYCPTCRTLQDGKVHKATTITPTADGPRNYRIVSSPILDANGNVTAAVEMVEDISDQIALEAQLRQAQKMEFVGRLAGGVAHDYNNALSVIVGFTELAMDKIDPTVPAHEDLGEVLKAAKRATDITRQLLAFARKQTIAPKILNLNENVESMLKMVRRLIGEDITLAWLPEADLLPVKMDPSQIDQILANLCVNARDAIFGVGKITIETKKAAFDTAYCADHHGFTPGQFVMLAVSDNGCGMNKEVLDNIFEPFFTTKDLDKGTGLGLSTVYGIVKQNKGFINVYSEPGTGTTIKIYLPHHEDNAIDVQRQDTEDIPSGQGETIMVAEDDPSILKLAEKILKGLGYVVLTANRPKRAIELMKEHTGEIHLLVTDVIMPEMSGLELVNNIRALNPDLKSVFMSGYTSDTIAHHGVLNKGVHFIQKPFSKEDLAKIVRKALDEVTSSVQG